MKKYSRLASAAVMIGAWRLGSSDYDYPDILIL